MSMTSAIKTHHDEPLVFSVYQAFFFAVLLTASLYQLSVIAKISSIILCICLAVYGQFGTRQPGSWFVYSYALLVVTLAVLSAADLVDGAWTTIREVPLVVRQASIHLLLPFTAVGFAALLRFIGGDIRRLAFLYIVPLTLISIPVYTWTGQAGMTDEVFIINNLYSMEAFRIFFIGALLLSIRSNAAFVVLFIAISLFAVSVQSILCMAVILTARMISVRVWMIHFALALVVVLALVSTAYWQELLEIENNIGFRALFWKNALAALFDTHLIGVGYGTESIIPFYPHNGEMRYFGPELPELYSVIGVHSSFFQQLFNTGILGAFLLCGWMVYCISRLGGTTGTVDGLDVLAVGMLGISFFVNMAFDSYNFLLGSSFLLGWIIYKGNLRSASAVAIDEAGSQARLEPVR
jgi:hypothetical protein